MKSKTKNSITSAILSALSEIGEMLPVPFETPYGWIKRAGNPYHKRYYDAVYELRKRGSLGIFKKNNQRFLKITKKGELEILLLKARIKKPEKWDGKWRLIIFDIPEGARDKRDQLRYLLKQNGFRKLQASVFINPYPLNREAIAYLKKTGLIVYIRMLRVDEIDDDGSLRKFYHLSKS